MNFWQRFRQKHIKTPLMLQMDATECGAAALGSILAYYGCYVSLETLRIRCEVSRHGCRADLLCQAARAYALEAQTAAIDLEDLTTIRLPVIAHWKFNHFIVLEEVSKTGIHVNDPAVGHRLIDWDTFAKDFTGVIILLTPTKDFQKTIKPFSVLKRLLPKLKQHRWVLSSIFLLSLLLIIPGLIIPAISMAFINNVLIKHLHGWLIPLLVGLALTAVFRVFFSFFQQSIILKLRIRLTLASSKSFISHLLDMPIDFFYKRFAGDIISRIAANDRISLLLSNELITSLIGLISMVFFAIVMCFYNLSIGLSVIVITALNAFVFFSLNTALADNNRTYLQHWGRLSGVEMNQINMIESIKAEALETHSFIRWSSILTKVVQSAHKAAITSQKLLLSSYISQGLTQLILLSLGILFIITGHLSIGALVALQSLAISFQAPVNTLLSLGNNLQKIRGDIQRLDDLMHQATDPMLTAKKMTLQNLTGSLSLENISFGYSRYETPLINALSLRIPAKTHIAIVGSTGSGKSTIAKLMTGLYQPWDGQIRYDNYDLRHLSYDDMANYIAVVDQEINLFVGTIRENLQLWDKTIADDILIQALKDAALYDELNQQHHGHCLDLHLLEQGSNLSAGQRQRLDIARALVKQPKILLLDEATANLDTITEAQILLRLKQLPITLIIISHRLSMIQDCDCIYVIDKGQIIDSGLHDVLFQNNAAYAALIALENASYAD